MIATSHRLPKASATTPVKAVTAALLFLAGGYAATAGAVTPTSIAQAPVTVAQPSRPQILFAVSNSQSMDGTLAGAIMTGAGALGSGLSALQSTSSPTNYTIPSGFTPPLNAGSGGVAPYTVTTGGTEFDNSPSRLNIAKASITSILTTFLQNADFALMDYTGSGLNEYTTWVYYMSPVGQGFTFTNTPGSYRYVANPCYYVSGSTNPALTADCNGFQAFYGSTVYSTKYITISASSDDTNINDVLYVYPGQSDPLCIVYNTGYGGPSPSNPYAAGISAYNTDANSPPYTVFEKYSASFNNCQRTTGPTNAGYVPDTNQVMYAERGFGYYVGTQTGNTGTSLVSMTNLGSAPSASAISTALATFQTYLQPETNSTSTSEIKASETQAPTAGLLIGALNQFKNITANPCNAPQYVVLVTDGLPTMDSSNGATNGSTAGYYWPPLGSTSAAGYNLTATFNTDGSLASTADTALSDAIKAIKNLYAANIKVYVIGLGAGVDPSLNASAAATLKAMAVAGGTGNYFAATSPAALVDDMQSILTTILSATGSSAAVAVNATYIHTGALSYQASFNTSDTDQDWTGNLAAYPINTTTGAVATGASNAQWSAQAQLDAQNYSTGRFIATWDPVTQKGIPFRWTGGTPSSGIATSTLLGQELATNTADPSGSDALSYLRGNRALEIQNGGQYRNRTHVLGDIVDSAPLYVGPPAGSYQTASYYSFESTYSSRPAVLYVGANDGMLHAFNATNGSELFAYVPNGVFANLINLTYTYYNEQHRFFVDGSPQAADVQFSDNSWHTVLVGGLNAGGKSIYALDVTNPSSLSNESNLAAAVLWDFTDANMGLTFSAPAIGDTAAGFAVFFGNGYNSPTQTPYLYALNPQTGAVLAKINLCGAVPTACDTANANGLSSVVLTNTTGAMGNFATLLYAGDLQGNLWRVDISSATPANWSATLLFQARDSTGAVQPITTTPATSLNPLYPRIPGTMVYIGTGQLLGLSDLTTTQTQTVYGIYDSGAGTTVLRSNLRQQIMSLYSGNSALRVITSNTVNIPSVPGWYVDFTLLSGERIVTDPVVDSGAVIVTSNSPSYSLSQCTAGDTAWLNEFNYSTGGKFPTPQFDTNGSGSVNASDVNASGLLLGSVFASSPSITTLSGAGAGTSGTRVKEIGTSSSTIKNVAEKGASQQRTSWWELRGVQ